jgi:acetyltransferase-like isoleucine patch superfamily enzyme
MDDVKYLIKKIVYGSEFLYRVHVWLRRQMTRGSISLNNHGYGRLIRDIKGRNNTINIGKNTCLNKTTVRIRGNNNSITFDDGCHVGEDCSFWMEGNNIIIRIGAHTTFTHGVHFCAQEDGCVIEVGKDCMFSNTITVRTSDSHPIYDIETNQRINAAKGVRIGNHVWVAPDVRIMKGVTINDGAIIGSGTIVTRDVPGNALAVGHPARVVKEKINWTREKLF